MPALILETLAANAAFALAALPLGEALLRVAEAAVGVEPAQPSLRRLGAALLAGFGGWALAGIPLAAAHLFRWQALAVCGVASVVLGRRVLAAYARRAPGLLARARGAGRVVQVALAVALAVGVANWLGALAPPEATDELAYHLPEARTLADTHVLHLTLGSDRIYGNLPTLAETLWGEALTVRGTSLLHALHFSLVVSFVLLAAGVVRALWGSRAAALAVAGIALYPDLLHNATTGYVDAAEASFEVGALLLLVLWTERHDAGDAAAAALLLGFALAVKYTALPSAAMAALLVAVVVVRERRWRLGAALTAIGVCACGYWYGKNLVRLGNPVFPFAFGHRGVTDATYRYFAGTVHQFGPRTVSAFLDVPTRLGSNETATAYLGYVLSPLALFARGPRRAAALLLAFVAVYTTYWFWLGSHQTRFLMPAVLVAIVLGSVALGAARGRAWVAAAAVLAAAGVGYAHLHSDRFEHRLTPALSSWLQGTKLRYALGLESTDAYLRHYFGCQVDAVAELAAHHLRGAVGLWELAPPPDYPRENRLLPLHVTATTPAAARTQLRSEGFRYLLGTGASAVGLSTNPAAQPVLAAARPFWRHGDCTLFRLELGP
jgi:hypothetical protein